MTVLRPGGATTWKDIFSHDSFKARGDTMQVALFGLGGETIRVAV